MYFIEAEDGETRHRYISSAVKIVGLRQCGRYHAGIDRGTRPPPSTTYAPAITTTTPGTYIFDDGDGLRAAYLIGYLGLDLAIGLVPTSVFVRLSKSNSRCKQKVVIKVAELGYGIYRISDHPNKQSMIGHLRDWLTMRGGGASPGYECVQTCPRPGRNASIQVKQSLHEACSRRQKQVNW
ncbi:hypothetical protein P167DRAFT_550160 [Morchella conica CCBAS932]|uniref:Uncharacterized protein n=1 Tax=Morchella conica CCBAS932 TaxID=1392247 RepID=A0A3N4K8T8_9PEZI|nr:hypothetical protein P167DRAFT_550160 [Morchella conica CCBAS932]